MAPSSDLLPLGQGPRVVVYHQTHHDHQGNAVPILPLVTQRTGVTHVIIAAIHLNDGPGNITLNDTPPSAEKFNTLWAEVSWLQASGVRVLGMLGGAAKGSYAKLDGTQQQFEAYYLPLAALIRLRRLDGLDLDVEEETSLAGIIRLIDRLKSDFGAAFLITLAPVATALLPLVPLQKPAPHLSGFSYHALEQMRGASIAWYNTQFYCGWGDMRTTAYYDAIVSQRHLFPPNKVVVGLVTNPENGAGHVDMQLISEVLRVLRARYHPAFGGVMGWEYFNSLPGARERPWEWAASMARCVRAAVPIAPGLVEGGTGVERPGLAASSGVTMGMQPFPAESIRTLTELGFSDQQAVAALNRTGGNVEYAAGLLFED